MKLGTSFSYDRQSCQFLKQHSGAAYAKHALAADFLRLVGFSQIFECYVPNTIALK